MRRLDQGVTRVVSPPTSSGIHVTTLGEPMLKLKSRAVRAAFAMLMGLGVLTAVSAGSPAAGAQPDPPASAPAPLDLPCAEYPGGDTICSGEVKSFDGSPLDVDVTLPSNGSGGKHPLMVMFHGFGNNKHEWESTTDAGDGAD